MSGGQLPPIYVGVKARATKPEVKARATRPESMTIGLIKLEKGVVCIFPLYAICMALLRDSYP